MSAATWNSKFIPIHVSAVTVIIIAGLIRFIPRSTTQAGVKALIGQPVNADQDVGLASRKGEEVRVEVYEGSSILEPGKPSGKIETLGQLLSPIAQSEVGSIRCIGLNVRALFLFYETFFSSWFYYSI